MRSVSPRQPGSGSATTDIVMRDRSPMGRGRGVAVKLDKNEAMETHIFKIRPENRINYSHS